MAKSSTNQIRPEMQGKALCFVGGTMRPAVAHLDAPYVLRHPDGSPMLAESTSDTVAACRERWQKTQSNGGQQATEPELSASDAAVRAAAEAGFTIEQIGEALGTDRVTAPDVARYIKSLDGVPDEGDESDDESDDDPDDTENEEDDDAE